MLMITCALLLLSSAFVPDVQSIQQPAKDSIFVDGRTTPELIPDYVLWEHGFGGLALINEKNMKAARASLSLSPKDMALTFEEAERQKAREEESVFQQRRRREALKASKAEPAEVRLELEKIILDYRWSVLQARDRLLAALTPEGQATLLIWMEARRANITMVVAKADWEFFRKPR